MLVLTRKEGEGTTLTLTEALPAGTQIHILPVRTQPDRVRIGFTAPRSVHIERDELIGSSTPPLPDAAAATSAPASV